MLNLQLIRRGAQQVIQQSCGPVRIMDVHVDSTLKALLKRKGKVWELVATPKDQIVFKRSWNHGKKIRTLFLD
jgi:hypothetical protein